MDSASTPEQPLDYFRLRVEGMVLQPGDRITFAFGSTVLGDLGTGDALSLDGRFKAMGRLGTFSKCKANYKPRTRSLTLMAAKGVASGGLPIFLNAGGVTGFVVLSVNVDRAPFDGLADADLSVAVPKIFEVKVTTSPLGVKVESGRCKL